MRRIVTSLFLLLTLGGSALAGAPLRADGQACGMGGAMSDMDCCKSAGLDQKLTPEAATAIINCVLDCSQEGSAPTGNVSLPQYQPTILQIRLNPQTDLSLRIALRKVDYFLPPPTDSQPVYIRNLALLI
ncbi:MAG: hypothetical protein ABIP75_04705 [Pyrinomonadaceae bacterium]